MKLWKKVLILSIVIILSFVGIVLVFYMSDNKPTREKTIDKILTQGSTSASITASKPAVIVAPGTTTIRPEDIPDIDVDERDSLVPDKNDEFTKALSKKGVDGTKGFSYREDKKFKFQDSGANYITLKSESGSTIVSISELDVKKKISTLFDEELSNIGLSEYLIKDVSGTIENFKDDTLSNGTTIQALDSLSMTVLGVKHNMQLIVSKLDDSNSRLIAVVSVKKPKHNMRIEVTGASANVVSSMKYVLENNIYYY